MYKYNICSKISKNALRKIVINARIVMSVKWAAQRVFDDTNVLVIVAKVTILVDIIFHFINFLNFVLLTSRQ